MTTLSPEFEAAVKQSKQLSAKPSTDELLELYSLYKQALQDPPFEKSEVPGMFDLKAKAKRSAWSKLVDEGVTPEVAQTRYIALIETLKEKYGFDPTKAPEPVGGS